MSDASGSPEEEVDCSPHKILDSSVLLETPVNVHSAPLCLRHLGNVIQLGNTCRVRPGDLCILLSVDHFVHVGSVFGSWEVSESDIARTGLPLLSGGRGPGGLAVFHGRGGRDTW